MIGDAALVRALNEAESNFHITGEGSVGIIFAIRFARTVCGPVAVKDGM